MPAWWRAVAVGLPALALLTGCGWPAIFSSHPRGQRPASSSPGPAQVQGQGATLPATPPSALGGALGVVVDNYVAARPQSGLSRASMVFEAPVEGGITRFLALFWQYAASQIGPVRSTRIYFDELAQAYAIPLAHAGGNVDALRAIGPLGVKNLDEIYGSGPYFWRTLSRVPPQNLYTSTALLLKGVRQHHLTLGPVPTWPTGPLHAGSPAGRFTVAFSGVEVANWLYQKGWYVRYEGSTQDLTLNGHAIRARGVLALVTPEAPDPDPYTPGAIRLDMTGQGQGWLAANGRVVAVRWTRQAGKPFRILTAGGKGAQPLPPPPLWVELVPTSASVSWSASPTLPPG
jgi:hypothetical protein